MRIRANKSFFESRDQTGSQKVSQAKSSRAWSTPQSISTEAVQTASNQQCHGSAFLKSRGQKRANRRRKSGNRGRGAVNHTKIHKHDTIAPAVGPKCTDSIHKCDTIAPAVAPKCTDSKYDTIAPAVGLKYSVKQSETVRVIVRSNNLGALKARIVVQLGDVSIGQKVGTEEATVKSEAELLTKSAGGSSGTKTSNNKPKEAGPNSQGQLKSNFKSWNKSFGRKKRKNKGYTSPNSEKGNSIPVRSYTPFTEAQKRNFTKLLKETLPSDC